MSSFSLTGTIDDICGHVRGSKIPTENIGYLTWATRDNEIAATHTTTRFSAVTHLVKPNHAASRAATR